MPTWRPMELNDNDLPEHYVLGEVDGVHVSLQIRVGATTSELNPLVVAHRLAEALNRAAP